MDSDRRVMPSDDEVRRRLAEARQQGFVTLANLGQRLSRYPGTTPEQRVIIRDALTRAVPVKLQGKFATALKAGGPSALATAVAKARSGRAPDDAAVVLGALQAVLRVSSG
jgi:hypothetical protein